MIALDRNSTIKERQQALLAALLDRGADRFDMTRYVRPSAAVKSHEIQAPEDLENFIYDDCGTTCCIAGTGALLLPGTVSEESLKSGHFQTGESAAVAAAFGLPSELFYLEEWHLLEELPDRSLYDELIAIGINWDHEAATDDWLSGDAEVFDAVCDVLRALIASH